MILEAVVLGGVIAGVGGLINLLGSYWEGEISESQFKRELAFMQKKLDAQIAIEAKRLGLQEKQLKQQWEQFTTSLKQRKYEFEETFGLQKETLAHRKYMDIMAPVIERKRRAKNLTQAFSNIARNPLLRKPAPGGAAGILGGAPAAPGTMAGTAAPANPLIAGGA